MTELVGWVATALTAGSYFSRRPVTLRWIQATSACLWLGYGFMIHSRPVLVANVFVIGAAIGSTFLRGVRAPNQTAS